MSKQIETPMAMRWLGRLLDAWRAASPTDKEILKSESESRRQGSWWWRAGGQRTRPLAGGDRPERHRSALSELTTRPGLARAEIPTMCVTGLRPRRVLRNIMIAVV